MPSLVNSTFWSAIQRFGGLAISFVSNIVLARLLSPDDYGVMGLIMVFIGFADILIDGGFGNALIQKKEVSKKDISTVFTTNLIISIILFSIIFFSAPSIASYFEIDKFSLFLRIEAIIILVRALFVIHFTILNRKMDFQKLAKINLIASSLSTVIAIIMAISGCGIWSLIIRNLALDIISLILYYFTTRLDLSFYICKESFTKLFGFGIFVLVANLSVTIYSNLLTFILGKKFSVKELGYYNQAYSLEQIPVYSVSSILNQVLFPFLSKEQDDLRKLQDDVEKSMQAMSFLIYPMMTFLICFAKPLIILLYSEKWLPSVPFFQILCTLGYTNFIYNLNVSLLKAIGRSRALFYSQLVGCVIGLILIVISIQFGIYAVVISVAINSIIGMLIQVVFGSYYIGLKLFGMLKYVWLNFFLSIIVGGLVYWGFLEVSLPPFLLLVLGLFCYSLIYWGVNSLIGNNSYKIVKSVVFNTVKSLSKH